MNEMIRLVRPEGLSLHGAGRRPAKSRFLGCGRRSTGRMPVLRLPDHGAVGKNQNTCGSKAKEKVFFHIWWFLDDYFVVVIVVLTVLSSTTLGTAVLTTILVAM